MATVTWLGDVLRAAGCEVIATDGWRERGRPPSTGGFDPIGVLWHHTATRATLDDPYPTRAFVISGSSALPGPLCHLLLDRRGRFHLIAAGRANHAGASRGSGPIPAGDGNATMVGIEIEYDGVEQRMLQRQYDAAVLGTAAVLRRLGRPARYARGHRETSTTGKIDPTGVDLDAMRADVRARLEGWRA